MLQQLLHFGCERSSLGGALSESDSVFDPERLKPIIESLGEKQTPIAAAYALRSGSRRSPPKKRIQEL
jgi:hypothetical protein